MSNIASRIRFSDSLYYNPGKKNDRVVLEARCQFLGVVFKHEPDVLEQLTEKILPLQPGIGLDFFGTFLSDHVSQVIAFISQSLKTKRRMLERNENIDNVIAECERASLTERGNQIKKFKHSLEDIHQLDEAIEPLADGIAQIVLSHGDSRDAMDVTLCLTDFYTSTCLHKLGDWALSLLLHYAQFCNYYELDPKDCSNLYYMISRDSFHGPNDITPSPRFTFSLLSKRDYLRRLASLEPYAIMPISQSPTWIYDYENDVYITYQLPLQKQPFAETAGRTDRAFKEALKHYEGRCKEGAESNGLRSFSGSRKRMSHPEDRFYWLYLYLTTKKTVEEIQDIAIETSEKEESDGTKVPSVEVDIQRTAELMCIPIMPFGERNKLLRELAKI